MLSNRPCDSIHGVEMVYLVSQVITWSKKDSDMTCTATALSPQVHPFDDMADCATKTAYSRTHIADMTMVSRVPRCVPPIYSNNNTICPSYRHESHAAIGIAQRTFY